MQTESLRIVAISDTHNNAPHIPKGDIIIHAGDATGRGSLKEIKNFIGWFAYLPHKYKIFVAGNHDWYCQNEPSKAAELFKEVGIVYLQDSSIVINGLKIYGSPWQPEFCDWAFNLPRGEALAEKWAKIPKDTDILITHTPPFGILDECPTQFSEFTKKQTQEFVILHSEGRGNEFKFPMKSVGCEELTKRVKIVKPRLHIFGHIHECYGTHIENGIIYKNVSICNSRYQPMNIPHTIFIDNKKEQL